MDIPLTDASSSGDWVFMVTATDNGSTRARDHGNRKARKSAPKDDVWMIISPRLPPAGQPRDRAIYLEAQGEPYLIGDAGKFVLKATKPVTWSMTLGAGSVPQFVNDQGAPLAAPADTAYVKYSLMPSSNAGFGPKTVVASRGGTSKSREVRLFYLPTAFPPAKSAHPPIQGAEAPYNVTVPNWFYYMLQIPTVPSGTEFLFDLELTQYRSGITRWENRPVSDPKWPNLLGWKCFLGPNTYSDLVWLADWNAIRIDGVAWVCRHEKMHLQHLTQD